MSRFALVLLMALVFAVVPFLSVPTAEAALGVGDAAMEWEVGEMLNSDPVTLADLRGRVIVYEFFGTYCGPCKQQVSHLNELHEKYGAQGLAVISVTKEPKAAVEGFIKETSAKYPFLIDAGDTAKAYGVTSIPYAAVIAPNGRIAWTGNPGSLSDGVLTEQLASARILPELPSALSSVKKALGKDEFAKARQTAEKALAHKDEATRTAAEAVMSWIDWFAESAMTGAATDAQNGKAYDAWTAYDRIACGYKGLEVGKTAGAKAAELLADETAEKAIDAGRRYVKLMAEVSDLSPKKALKKVEPFVKKYEGTPHGDRAKALLAELEKAAD